MKQGQVVGEVGTVLASVDPIVEVCYSHSPYFL